MSFSASLAERSARNKGLFKQVNVLARKSASS